LQQGNFQMSKKRVRIDTSADREPLGDNPFAGLAPMAGEAPAKAPVESPLPAAAPRAQPAWTVGKTRKGGWPLRVEKRAGNKLVTVLGNVRGDAAALLSHLKKQCGAGGVLREDSVELQGDQSARVAAVLDANREI